MDSAARRAHESSAFSTHTLEPDRLPSRGSPSGSIFVQADDNFEFGMPLARFAHASPRTFSNPNAALRSHACVPSEANAPRAPGGASSHSRPRPSGYSADRFSCLLLTGALSCLCADAANMMPLSSGWGGWEAAHRRREQRRRVMRRPRPARRRRGR